MSDMQMPGGMGGMMGGKPPMGGGMPPQGNPGMPPQSGAVEKNLSIFNPKDFVIMVKTMANDPQATVRDLLSRLGIDADGPVAQITQFLQKGMENATPLGQMKNIALGAGPDTGLSPGGQPPVMPGRKPMVQPPSAPAPAGLSGLINRMGGK